MRHLNDPAASFAAVSCKRRSPLPDRLEKYCEQSERKMNERKSPAIETGYPADDLFHFKRNGKISRRSFSMGEMQKAGEEGGLLLASTKAETSDELHPDHWEIHPRGDELIFVLAGEVRLVLE